MDDLSDWLGSGATSLITTTWIVESSEKRALGFCRAGEDPADSRRGHIYSLYVHPEAQGLGIGTALLEQCLTALAERKLAPVTLWVFERNRVARRLYAAAGFYPDGARRVEPEYGAEEIRMLHRPALSSSVPAATRAAAATAATTTERSPT